MNDIDIGILWEMTTDLSLKARKMKHLIEDPVDEDDIDLDELEKLAGEAEDLLDAIHMELM